MFWSKVKSFLLEALKFVFGNYYPHLTDVSKPEIVDSTNGYATALVTECKSLHTFVYLYAYFSIGAKGPPGVRITGVWKIPKDPDSPYFPFKFFPNVTLEQVQADPDTYLKQVKGYEEHVRDFQEKLSASLATAD